MKPRRTTTTDNAGNEPTTTATAKLQVERSLSSVDDQPPAFISSEALLTPQVGLPVLIGLGLIGGAVAVRRRSA